MATNPYDKAHELARAIRDHEVFIRYAAATRALRSNEEATQRMLTFQQLQMELNQAQMAGEEISETKSAHLQLSYNKLREDPITGEFLTAEDQFLRLFTDLQNVIHKDMELDLG
ncbi:MAG: YlbF family regulator [Syntrophomonadaceae bacterium]|nr:YlbF family regulator [Syntrophomonadaceae bacterium]